MDIISMFAALVAVSISCPDIISIRDNLLSDKKLPQETKQEIIDVLYQVNPECELNERPEDT
tara:strand:- start:124 stop:309 length:186 start_codon:yes stop_codon:yes gene_type:complete